MAFACGACVWVAGLVRDVLTVFHNCRLYFEPTSALSRMAKVGRSLSAVLRAPRAPAHGGTDASAPFGAAYSQFPRPEHSDKGVDVACRP